MKINKYSEWDWCQKVNNVHHDKLNDWLQSTDYDDDGAGYAHTIRSKIQLTFLVVCVLL